ncbi:MAG: hypothetical protein BWX74_00203 [Tenericutes bacterium ADurb.Bin087]|nr:MAG: hypothetical protein BWX74_00203 [Tenericutes bacterium ADurb.Bin087]
MIKHILNTTEKIIDGSLAYQQFSKDLKQDTTYSQAEKHQIRTLVNALLNRYFRYLYSLTEGEESTLKCDELLALGLFSFNREKKVMPLSYEDFLAALPTETQVKFEEEYPDSSFPIKIPKHFHSENQALSLAARFSIPLPVVEQLLSDIGRKNLLKFLTNRYRETYGLINHAVISDDEFFAKMQLFTRGFKPGEFEYKGKDYIKKTPAYNNNEIVIASQTLLDVVDIIEGTKPKTLLFVQHEDTSLMLVLALKYPEIQIHFYKDDNRSRYIVRHLVRKFALENVTYIDKITQTYDFVLTTLQSSNINGDIRHRDFYFRLPENLQFFAAKGREELDDLKDYVADDGYLMFITTTVLRFETHLQAVAFVRDYPEFELKLEKQHFHFTPNNETLYFALLKKGVHVEEA